LAQPHKEMVLSHRAHKHDHSIGIAAVGFQSLIGINLFFNLARSLYQSNWGKFQSLIGINLFFNSADKVFDDFYEFMFQSLIGINLFFNVLMVVKV
jgi:hypothetical protein